MALEAEKSLRLEEAKDKYAEAVGLFLAAVKSEPNPARKGS